MDSFASAIKNQHSFNKMIESQIAQLVAAVPLSNKGKIPGQPEDLETINLIDIHNVAYYYMEPSMGKWIDYILSEKKSDPGRPVIPSPLDITFFRKLSMNSEQVSISYLR
jgi:hypothetical protein